MTQRNIAHMRADDLWQDWRTDIERITNDAHELFALRRHFREIAFMYERNSELQEAGANLWGWLRICYGAAVLMRVRREVDTQAHTVNLRTLLEEIEKRPDVITRQRISARSPGISEHIARVINDRFTTAWVGQSARGASADQIDPALVRADRLSLETATAKLEKTTNLTLAHRPRKAPPSRAVTGADAVFSLLETLLKKYLGLLTGAALSKLEPTPQYDTEAPFMFPWHPKAYAEWQAARGKRGGE